MTASIDPEAVAWCQQAITRRHPAFRFHRADLARRAYNPRGEQAGLTVRDLRRGRWWCGERHDQDVVTAVTDG